MATTSTPTKVGAGGMEEAILASVYVTSPDYSGWLQKRGFHV